MWSRRIFAGRVGGGYFGTGGGETVSAGTVTPDALLALILALPAPGAVAAGDLFPIVSVASGVAAQVTAAEVLAYVAANASGTWGISITGAAPAASISGTTLAANVVTSSLTTVGTIGAGTWQGTAIANAFIATGLDVAKLTVGTTLPSNVVTSSLTTIGTLVAGTVPAARVSAGTFQAGAYTIDAGNVGIGFTVTAVRTTVGSSVLGLSFTGQSQAASGTTPEAVGISGNASSFGSGTVSALVGIRAQVARLSGTVTSGYAIRVIEISTAMTNAYGVYVEAITGGTSLNYAIYTNAGLIRFGDVVNTTESYQVDGTKVVGNQGAAIADSAVDLTELTGKFNDLLARIRAHGLIAT